jgi:uncharacterized protein YbbC (DUF1343 family)
MIQMAIRLAAILIISFLASGNKTCRYTDNHNIKSGAHRTAIYLPLLAGKNVGLVANNTSLINNTHLADSLQRLGINIISIFTPEHGFTGTADAGEPVSDSSVSGKNIKLISLYNGNNKPSAGDLKDIDIMVFDIQDVGVRFYTYISTLHYVMEACAQAEIPLVVLDRPNPNGYYVDGPVLQAQFISFIGMHPVPVVYGMTIGEYAQMINGERWLGGGLQCPLKVVLCENYRHDYYYELPVSPSPNLGNMRAVYLYPSLCLFEGTVINVGRGTDFPFQVYGHPEYREKDFFYIPQPTRGAKNPRHRDTKCYGVDLRNRDIESIRNEKQINLSYITDAYRKMNRPKNFFTDYFNYLAGNAILKKQIVEGLSEEQIRSSWHDELSRFKTIRKKYLLYPDFE